MNNTSKFSSYLTKITQSRVKRPRLCLQKPYLGNAEVFNAKAGGHTITSFVYVVMNHLTKGGKLFGLRTFLFAARQRVVAGITAKQGTVAHF